ncbi:MAG: hypothetical protein ACXVA9_14185, partial [Bdellovibrionales bacterium]
NLILLTELVVLWFLLHKAKAVRNTLLALFVLFHLYSAIFVGFRFPLLTLPMLLFLFTIDEVHSDRGLTSTGIVLTILLIMMNAGPVALGLNPKLTGQGAQFALNMFDANRQAVFKYEIIYGDREPVKVETSHFDAFDRDRPYNQWYRLKKMCGDPSIKQISYNILLSANGGPFREIVNLNNVCESEFLPFSPNSWIQLNGPVKGYPGKNYYWLERDAGSVQQVKIYPEAQIQTGVIGDFILKNLTTCKRLYWLVAIAVFSIMSTPYLRRKLGLRL